MIPYEGDERFEGYHGTVVSVSNDCLGPGSKNTYPNLKIFIDVITGFVMDLEYHRNSGSDFKPRKYLSRASRLFPKDSLKNTNTIL